MESWQYLNPEGRLKRLPYLYRFIALSLLAIIGGYFLHKILVSDNDIAPYYLEISFSWSIVVLALLTPLAIQRCRDFGVSVWWVIILWLSPFSSLKFYILVSEYTGLTISGTALMVSSFVGLLVLFFLVMLFFSRSTLNASNQSAP